jgi:hypothetical protein
LSSWVLGGSIVCSAVNGSWEPQEKTLKSII